MGIDLSILIPSTHTRWESFGQKIQAQVWPQYNALSEQDQRRVEILFLADNKQMMLGQKRNIMVDVAQGDYVVFVDDDDRIASDYISSLLDAIEQHRGVDTITFRAEVTLNGGIPKLCRYSSSFKRDTNAAKEYRRIPNHICCTRRELAATVSYPNILKGEDSGYSKLLLPLLKTEHHIPRILYYYDYSDETTETQQKLASKPLRQDRSPVVDVVMLSKASTPALQRMTQRAIDTCVSGANGLPVNVIVLEGQPGIKYTSATTIPTTGRFRYNRFANEGAKLGSAEWIMVANNDLVFTDGWLHALLAAENDLVSPKCPHDSRQRDIVENTLGDRTGRHLSGWCYMIRRTVWKQIGGFDEDFDFWCADDSVIEQCKAVGVQPMLVPSSVVQHLGSRTGGTDHGDGSMTWAMIKRFSDKYYPHRLSAHGGYKAWLETQTT